eukprot:7576825-Alexandrium_andersonii.AAC.1
MPRVHAKEYLRDHLPCPYLKCTIGPCRLRLPGPAWQMAPLLKCAVHLAWAALNALNPTRS